MHHSRTRTWIERLRRRMTGRVPYRCRACGWRGWRHEPAEGLHGPRKVHRELTDAEIERLEPDAVKGERL
jgi:hypothetical protein